jgi:hypothetical protein
MAKSYNEDVVLATKAVRLASRLCQVLLGFFFPFGFTRSLHKRIGGLFGMGLSCFILFFAFG